MRADSALLLDPPTAADPPPAAAAGPRPDHGRTGALARTMRDFSADDSTPRSSGVAGSGSRGVRSLRRLQSWDEAVLLRMRRFHAPWGIRLMSFFTHLGDSRSWFAIAILMLATGTTLGIAVALRIGFAAGAGVLLTQPIKRIACRARPAVAIDGFEPLVEQPDAFSFPSGHTAVAFSIAIAFLGAPFGLGPLLLAAACCIGASRIYLGAHYPLDVGAGIALGVCAGLLGRVPADVYFPL